MNEITAITPQIKDKTRCNVYVDGRFCCGLKVETVVKNRLKVGVAVTEEQLSAMQLESEKMAALDKALCFISASRKTEKDVRAYLQKKGYLSAVSDHVVEKMKGYGYIDDNEYAKEYAQSAAKKKGKRLVALELKRKGVCDDAIDIAVDEMDGEDETARRLAEKYMRGKTATPETVQKAYRHLLSKGFDFDVAKAALQKVCGVEDDE